MPQVFWLPPQDLDHDRDETLASASHAAAQALRRAIVEHQQAHSLNHWVKAFAAAFGATALAFALIWLAGRALRALARKIIEASTAHVQRLAVAGIPLLRRARAAAVTQTLVTSAQRVLVLLSCLQWTSFTLSEFPYTRPWGESINSGVLDLGKSGLTFFARVAPDILA